MTRVKICGLSDPEAVARAVTSGADYIGFVFAPSKRQVTLTQAHNLAAAVPERVKTVGVFVSPSLEELQAAIAAVPLDLVQIHGDFPDSLIRQVSVPVIRALQVSNSADSVRSSAAYLLFDAPLAGSGKTFDWQKLDTSQVKQPFFIAGGLNSGNAQAAIAAFHPYALDVSSGVETEGRKDLRKIKEFIESVKQ
ncbi:phosphoribosylanthranilate isomerase [Streptococcus tangpeifui]|uniref:N-(5'-phosphoribosyl)anthranilate isomerase n=1 Tax=Streptococcus criceti HS-6 TaxID=873449 RepID=G5JS18_STRCG|nr:MULTISPECIES: phosphoribosylanthranilate isomerase [Streptococcus]EHI75468.1 phosphoribosylanthranilate isomerase family protein [Streptococcus criceti HS-6]SUN42825.1 N-(5'-phosphoribosyl)anthranilate isomerase [Streptococcus criceti]